MIDLTEEEINVLINAVQCWEKEPSSEGTMKGMFSSLFNVLDPDWKNMSHEERAQRMEKDRRRQKEEIAALTELRRETSILLQAKLIAARNQTQTQTV